MSETDPLAYGLPHREPFIFVGSVREVRPGESAICEKTFVGDEPFFRGHFPGEPLVPGVIITEALAQTAGIAAGQAGKGFRLAAIRGMKFLRTARPGDRLILTARKIAFVGTLWQFDVNASVGDEKVAEGVIILSEAGG